MLENVGNHEIVQSIKKGRGKKGKGEGGNTRTDKITLGGSVAVFTCQRVKLDNCQICNFMMNERFLGGLI